jgi:ABC-type antimicrobial peptide transport system permease subunit
VAIPLKYTVRNLRERKVAAAMTALGIALVTSIFVATQGLVSGLSRALATTGDPLDIVVIRQNAKAETNSVVTTEQYRIMRDELVGVARDAGGEPLATGDVIFLLNVMRRGATDKGQNSNIMVRGVSPQSFAMRPAVRVVTGRAFRPGSDEVIVGRRLPERFDLSLGGKLRIKGRDWAIVGIFDGGETAFASEAWCDAECLLPEVRRDAYSSVTLRARDEAAVAALVKAIEDDPRLKLEALREPDYYAKQTEQTAGLLFMGFGLAAFLAIGACFGAMNTMYAAVAGRVREIATLRALGFRRRAILLAFVLEAAVLALPGAALGCALGALVNGVSTGTTNFVTFSEVAFSFHVGGAAVAKGLAFGLATGVLGGLFPAVRASRTPVSHALREA